MSRSSPPAPCRKTSGAPLPPSSTRQRVPFLVSTSCDFIAPTPRRSSRRRAGAPRGAGGRPSGWIHQRSSCFHSGQRSRRCGMTCSANSLVEWRVFQSGMLPLWNRQNRWPMRRPLMHSSSCWRTVSGLPAMMNRSSTSCFQVRFSRIFWRGQRELGQRPVLDRLDRAVARRIGEGREDVQAAVEEVEDVLGVEPLGLGVGVGHADDLREGGAVGRLVLAALGHPLPVAVQQRLAAQVAEERQVRVVVVVVEAEVPRLDRAAARDVDGRVRLLDRAWASSSPSGAGCTCRRRRTARRSAHAFMIMSCASWYLSRVSAGIWP